MINSLKIILEKKLTLLDTVVLLTIKTKTGSSKAELMEFIYGDRQYSKSVLDRPIIRLISNGYIDGYSTSTHCTRDYYMYVTTKSGARLAKKLGV